jgi:hypothetical protein
MKYKKDIVVNLCNEFERGKFSIINILKRWQKILKKLK